MTPRRAAALLVPLAAVLVAADGPPAPARDDPPPSRAEPAPDETKGPREKADDTPPTPYATFGGGCFWSMEAVFERVPGVVNVVSGFAGGVTPFPTYEAVHSGQTGHAEVVHVLYNPKVVSYDKLLKVFFSAHDPTTLNAQGDDVGTNYRSVILYHDLKQRDAALKAYKGLTARRAFRSPIVTQLVPFRGFFPAEEYHQDYFRNHSAEVYSQVYIIPKIEKLMRKGVLPTRVTARKRQRRAQPSRGESAASASAATNGAQPGPK